MYICITVMNMFSNGVVSASVDVSKTSSTLAVSQHAAVRQVSHVAQARVVRAS